VNTVTLLADIRSGHAVSTNVPPESEPHYPKVDVISGHIIADGQLAKH
jgi:hypothetical protein